jgi:CheY-like chemotaxis protein
MRFLLVGDVASCREMLARLLTKADCVCDEAKDGVEAIEKMRDSLSKGIVYDAIFMDASMPNMTGSDATQAIRALAFKGRIFGVTGNSLPEDVEEFLFKGADSVKIKPLRKEDVDGFVQGDNVVVALW